MKKKIWVPIVIVVLVLIGVGVGGWRWLYFGELNDQKVRVFSKAPLPAAYVGFSKVSMKEVLERKDLATLVYGGQDAPAELELTNQILDQLIANAQLAHIARNNSVSVQQAEVDLEYKAIISQAGEDESQFEKTLSDTYHLTVNDFKTKVVRQELLDNKLRAWFNGQKNLNNNEYATVDDVQRQLAEGKDFSDLAKSYSQDESTKQFGGDAGTVALGALLPELRDGLSGSSTGDVKMIPSRYGLHLVKVVERTGEGDGVQLHLQQIFIQAGGYDGWYDEQAKEIKVVRLLHHT